MSLTVYLASFLAAWLATVLILGETLRNRLAERPPSAVGAGAEG